MSEKQPIPDNATVLSHRLAEILSKSSDRLTISDLMEFFNIPEKLTGKKKQVYTGLRKDVYSRIRNAVKKLEQAEVVTIEYKKISGLKRTRTIYITYKKQPQKPETNV